MAPRPVGGGREGYRGGAGRTDDDPPDDPGGRRVDGLCDGGRAEGSARGLPGRLVEGRAGCGDGRGWAGLGLAVSGGGRVLWSGTPGRRWSVGRVRARSPAGGEVTRPPSGLTLGGAARSEESPRRVVVERGSSGSEGRSRPVVVGAVTTGGAATRALSAVWSALGRRATERGSSLRPCRATLTGVPASPGARSLNAKRGRAGLRGPTITTRSARYREEG